MAPPQAIPILGQMEDTPVRVSYLWIPLSPPQRRLLVWIRRGKTLCARSCMVLRAMLDAQILSPKCRASVEESVDFWWVPYLPKSCRPDFNQEVTRIVAPYCPPSVYLSSTRIMTPPQAIPTLCQIYICSCLIPMVSWWVAYLPKGCRSDFNNGLGGDSNIVAPFWPPAFIWVLQE